MPAGTGVLSQAAFNAALGQYPAQAQDPTNVSINIAFKSGAVFTPTDVVAMLAAQYPTKAVESNDAVPGQSTFNVVIS